MQPVHSFNPSFFHSFRLSFLSFHVISFPSLPYLFLSFTLRDFISFPLISCAPVIWFHPAVHSIMSLCFTFLLFPKLPPQHSWAPRGNKWICMCDRIWNKCSIFRCNVWMYWQPSLSLMNAVHVYNDVLFATETYFDCSTSSDKSRREAVKLEIIWAISLFKLV